jgi:hypothetical protein
MAHPPVILAPTPAARFSNFRSDLSFNHDLACKCLKNSLLRLSELRLPICTLCDRVDGFVAFATACLNHRIP